MAEASDMILPNSFRQALSADSLLGKLITGEFQQRIEVPEKKVERLEAAK